MNYKALLTVFSAFGLSLAMTSCSNDDPVSIETKNIVVSNYIIPDSPADPVTVQAKCQYNFRMDYVSNKLTVSTTELSIGSNTIKFTTDEMPFVTYVYQNLRSSDFVNGKAAGISGLHGYLTNIVFNTTVAGDPFPNTTSIPMAVMSFKADGYTVRTFSSNAYFSGETKTEFTLPNSDTPQSFTTKDALYRVNFSEDMKKANVVIYNIKFAEQAPALQGVVLRDLEVELERDGYRVHGIDKIPEMIEGGNLTPYPQRIFNSIEIKSSEDLTKIDCSYVCSKIFKGSFSGASCDHFVIKEEK